MDKAFVDFVMSSDDDTLKKILFNLDKKGDKEKTQEDKDKISFIWDHLLWRHSIRIKNERRNKHASFVG